MHIRWPARLSNISVRNAVAVVKLSVGVCCWSVPPCRTLPLHFPLPPVSSAALSTPVLYVSIQALLQQRKRLLFVLPPLRLRTHIYFQRAWTCFSVLEDFFSNTFCIFSRLHLYSALQHYAIGHSRCGRFQKFGMENDMVYSGLV